MQIRRKLSLIGLLLAILVYGSLTSCVRVVKKGCCTYRLACDSCLCKCSGRRPEVMVYYPPVIMDYAPEDEDPEADEGRTQIAEADLQPLQPHDEPYQIHKGDVLEVSIFTHDENTASELVVAPDGHIYYLYLPSIKAEGKTLEELAKELEERMAAIYTSPSVSLVAKVKAADYYMVLGQVGRPGVYPLISSVNIRQALADAGGVLGANSQGSTIQLASLNESYVIHNGKKLNVDFSALINEGREEQNVYLRPGDYVYIASSMNNLVYILGPFGGNASPYKDDLTLVGALSPAYGRFIRDPYARGNWRDVLIIRGNFSCPRVIRADFLTILSGDAKDIYLHPGDIVYVPNKEMRFGRELVKIAIDAFIGSFISNVAAYEANKLID